MGYNTNSTKWPTAVEVPQPVKDLVNRFYNLLDDDRPEVGAILADEIFTPDATAYFGGQPSTGSAGMSFDLHNITKRCLAWPFVNLLTPQRYPNLACKCVEVYREPEAQREQGICLQIRRQRFVIHSSRCNGSAQWQRGRGGILWSIDYRRRPGSESEAHSLSGLGSMLPASSWAYRDWQMADGSTGYFSLGQGTTLVRIKHDVDGS